MGCAQWRRPAGLVPVGYHREWKSSRNGHLHNGAAVSSPIRFTLPGSVEAGDEFLLIVVAENLAGVQDLSSIFPGIFVHGPGGVPSGVAAALGSGGLTVSWDVPPNNDDSDLTVSEYEIRYRDADDDTASWNMVEAAASATSNTIPSDDLTMGKHYDVQVRAVFTYSGDTYYGDWSDSVTAADPYIVGGVVAVTSTQQNAADTYGLGNVIEFTATFSEDVTVTGDPALEFCLGAATDECTDGNALRTATHDSTSGGDVVFTYTVLAADADADGISFGADAIKLDDDVSDPDSITGATTAAVAADLSHVAFGPDSGHKVDGTIEADLTAPTVNAAKVIENGAKIEIVFNEPLDDTSEPAASVFEVTVDRGTAFNPTGVEVSADTVTLTMASADTIAAGATVAVAYAKPSANPLKDRSTNANQAESFTGQAVPNRPAKPTGLMLIPGDGAISADWTAPAATGGSAITGYAVEYRLASAADSDYAAVSRADVAALTETIGSLTNDTEYAVRVRATNAAGNGPWSDEAMATPETPPAVTGAVVDVNDPDRIVLTYDKTLDTGSVPAADAFDVAVDGVSTEPSSVNITDANTVALTMAAEIAAGAAVAVDYTVPASNPLLRPTGQAAPALVGRTVHNRPAAPVVTLKPGDQEIAASWEAPANGGSVITSYVVEYRLASAADSAYTAVTRADAEATSETIGSLTNGIEYTVRVRAVNAAGNGPWSVAVSTTPAEADLTAPSVSEARLETDSSDDYKIIKIVFDEDLDGDSVPAASTFDVAVDGGTAVNPATVAISGATVTLTMAAEIAAGATVTVAYNEPTASPLQDLADDPDPNQVESFTGTDVIAVPNRPAAPVVTLTPASGQIIASWEAPANGGAAITGYEVQYQAAADSGYTTVSRADTAALSETITSLVDGTSYTVRVRAVSDAGNGPWAEAATIAGNAYPPPGGPYLFEGNRTMLVRWLPSKSATGDTDLQGWEIQWKSGTEDWSTGRQRYVEKDRDDDGDGTPDGLSFERRFTGLVNGTEYQYRVRARVTGRAALWTDPVAATPKVSGNPLEMHTEEIYLAYGDEVVTEADRDGNEVVLRLYDSLTFEVNDEGLKEPTLLRSVWLDSYHREEATAITGALQRWKAQTACRRFGPGYDDRDRGGNRDVTLLHPGATKADWEHVGFTANVFEITPWAFDCFATPQIRPSNVNGDAAQYESTQGLGIFNLPDPDPDVAELGPIISGNGSLTVRWEQEMWAGARVFADQPEHFPATNHFPVIQWVAADQPFLDDLYEAANNAGDNAGVYALDGEELKAALLAAEYTITGLENGTAYKVRFAYGHEGADQSVTDSPHIQRGDGHAGAGRAGGRVGCRVGPTATTIDVVFDQDLDMQRLGARRVGVRGDRRHGVGRQSGQRGLPRHRRHHHHSDHGQRRHHRRRRYGVGGLHQAVCERHPELKRPGDGGLHRVGGEPAGRAGHADADPRRGHAGRGMDRAGRGRRQRGHGLHRAVAHRVPDLGRRRRRGTDGQRRGQPLPDHRPRSRGPHRAGRGRQRRGQRPAEPRANRHPDGGSAHHHRRGGDLHAEGGQRQRHLRAGRGHRDHRSPSARR